MFRTLAVLLLIAAPATAGEVAECQRLAPKYHAATEVRLWDATRIDLLSDQYAIEVDYAPKWAEAIGQALYYASQRRLAGHDQRPAIILLTRPGRNEARYIYRCQVVCAQHGITLFIEPASE